MLDQGLFYMNWLGAPTEDDLVFGDGWFGVAGLGEGYA